MRFRRLSKNKKLKPLVKFSATTIVLLILFFAVAILFNHLLIVLPYSRGKTNVGFNKNSFSQSLKITSFDSLIVKPTIIVRINNDMPDAETLLRFQKLAILPELSDPSFGCNYSYSKFSRRIMIINLFVRGNEYLERFDDKKEAIDNINVATVACLMDIFSPDLRNDQKKKDLFWDEYNKIQENNPGIFKFTD